jgi:CheY-like chemotaxis protein
MMYKEHTSTVATAHSTQKTILFIEDHPIFSKIFARIITKYTSHLVVHLEDGREILQAMHEYRPDLLVLDYDLPGMNGIEIYDLVHNTAAWENIPAIMISASLPMREIRQRKISGLPKPCSSGDLLRAVEQALARAAI